MIKVEIHGRLGNQMFQYATARALQKQTGQELLLSFRTVYNEADKEGGKGWEDSLKKFKTVKYQTYSEDKSLLYLNSSVKQVAIGLCYYASYKPTLVKEPYNFQKIFEKQIKWAPVLNKNGIWWLKQGYYPFTASKQENYFLNGGFESRKYFDSIRNILLSEFVPQKEISPQNVSLMDYLKKSDSVCISMRHFKLKDKKREMVFSVCNQEYYNNAISKIKTLVNAPVFYVCSDDCEWVKSIVDFGDSKVIFEDSNEDPVMKLHIMSACRHFIISNSTYSWWAQYLGTSDNKIVISPLRWYNSEFESDLLNDETFIKI